MVNPFKATSRRVGGNISRGTKSRWFWIPALVAGISTVLYFVLKLILEDRLTTWINEHAIPFLAKLAALPVGFVGLIGVAIVAGCFLVMLFVATFGDWWRTRPKSLPKIDPQEKADIAAFRAFWSNSRGFDTVFGLGKLLDLTKTSMPANAYWVPAIESDFNALHDGLRGLSNTLELNKIAKAG